MTLQIVVALKVATPFLIVLKWEATGCQRNTIRSRFEVGVVRIFIHLSLSVFQMKSCWVSGLRKTSSSRYGVANISRSSTSWPSPVVCWACLWVHRFCQLWNFFTFSHSDLSSMFVAIWDWKGTKSRLLRSNFRKTPDTAKFALSNELKA